MKMKLSKLEKVLATVAISGLLSLAVTSDRIQSKYFKAFATTYAVSALAGIDFMRRRYTAHRQEQLSQYLQNHN
jgi:hypothetical protein